MDAPGLIGMYPHSSEPSSAPPLADKPSGNLVKLIKYFTINILVKNLIILNSFNFFKVIMNYLPIPETMFARITKLTKIFIMVSPLSMK